VATTVAAGALAMVLVASDTAAELGPAHNHASDALAVMLTSSDSTNPLQPEIDALLQAQQHVHDVASNYPFIHPSDLPMLDQFTQNLATTSLGIVLTGETFKAYDNQFINWAPLSYNAPAANPQQFLAFPNGDNRYGFMPVDSDQTYQLTVDPGPGTQTATFVPNSGNGVTTPLAGIETYHLNQFTPNPDGSYTITMSSTPQPGNWIDTDGASSMLIRDTMGNWGLPHDFITVQEEGAPSTFTLPVMPVGKAIAPTLGHVAPNIFAQSQTDDYFGAQQFADTIPDNTVHPIETRAEAGLPGPKISDQLSTVGHFSLDPDQAFIVKVPNIDATYTGFQVVNDWAQTAPYATVQGSLNDTQVFRDPDGYTYYVLSNQDPGVANWVDDSGLADGSIQLRWQGLTGQEPTTPIPVETHVVNVDDVSQFLPDDTPTVTPAERAADLHERLFDYDYRHDQYNGLAWLNYNLERDQIETAMGADQFHQVFGGQNELFGAPQHVPSVLERLTTPALSPELDTVGHDILTNPDGSLSALVNNLPLAIKDIELPTILAALRLEVVAVQTALAVQTDINSGDLSQVLTALGTGVQKIGKVFEETLTDPTTSITAGILNARDDLSVAVVNAPTSGTEPSSRAAPLWDSLIHLNQASFTLPQSSGDSAAALSADSASLGADLAPNSGELPWDLLP
jgi:hypothetical protein